MPAGHAWVRGAAGYREAAALTRYSADCRTIYAHRELLLFAMRDLLRTVYS
ncbi:hypothetical protein ARTHRO8AJ_440183 [Arthrobacter sp. 8AJ]|nr:hypothetical protein ARTHRO8AJ_440183 [Arthrobacter sp. 8AJ]